MPTDVDREIYFIVKKLLDCDEAKKTISDEFLISRLDLNGIIFQITGSTNNNTLLSYVNKLYWKKLIVAFEKQYKKDLGQKVFCVWVNKKNCEEYLKSKFIVYGIDGQELV